MSKKAIELALDALTATMSTHGFQKHIDQAKEEAIAALREAITERPAQQQEPEPDRVKFERHWRKTRGEKKANRELPRHPLQPQTYIQDSANRHWVTWQAAVRSVAPPAQQEPVAYDKTELNCFAQDLYDKKMREGKHGHYESMFHVIHLCIKKVASSPTQSN